MILSGGFRLKWMGKIRKPPSAWEGIRLGKKGEEKTERLGRSRKFQNQRFEYW